jgi:hypothetical protein
MDTKPLNAPAVTDQAARLRKLDEVLARPMFFLALAFLAIVAGVIHRIGHGHIYHFESALILWGIWLLWPLFLAEGLLRFFLRSGQVTFWRRLGSLALISLLPPVRMAARAYADPQRLWLPFFGWRQVDKHLRRDLERFFSVPMVIIALMVLPFLALEYFWADQMRANLGLALVFDVGTSIIWMAFAIEFTIMVSVAHHRVRYSFQNWMDVAVVALPLIDFLPVLRLLRLTRVLELQQISRLGRLYRLRGLLLKAWRAILILEMIQRVFGNAKEKRLKRLRELLIAREEELADLRKEIEELEKQLGISTAQQRDALLAEAESAPPVPK